MKYKVKEALAHELPFFLAIPAIVWQILFFYLPVLFVGFISFLSIENGVITGFTLANYATFFSKSYFHIIARSLALAFITAILCLLFGYPVAYYLARKADRWKNTLLFFLVLPFWTNMLVQVYAWFAILERKGFINNFLMRMGLLDQPLSLMNTPFSVYLVMVYYYLPFMIIPIYSVLEKLDEDYLEASLDLGANTLQTFFRVTLPLSMSGITTGFFLVFVPSFGEFVIPGLMGGNKYMYIGTLISYYYLTVRDEALGSAFTMVSIFVLVLVSLLLYRFFARFIVREGN